MDVSWSGTGWVLTNETTTAGITNIEVCALSTCGTVDSHSSEYRLYVDIVDPYQPGGGRIHHLQAVTFTTTDESDGKHLDFGACSLGAITVSPDSASYSATDTGSFECSFDCTQTGASVTITY